MKKIPTAVTERGKTMTKTCKQCQYYNKGMCHADPKDVKFVNPNDKCKREKKQ